MNHPYLRAYMAGIVAPTAFLLVVMTIFTLVRFVFEMPIPLERVIVFPMALIPNLFGAWNMLYVALSGRRRLPIGLHGALLPLVLAPLGASLGIALGVITLDRASVEVFEAVTVPYRNAVLVMPVVFGVYYLIWKYVVGFLNDVVGLD